MVRKNSLAFDGLFETEINGSVIKYYLLRLTVCILKEADCISRYDVTTRVVEYIAILKLCNLNN